MKNAIVTGGSSGIGLGVATMLAERGYKVFITYVGEYDVCLNPNIIPIKTDQSNREDLYRFINTVS